MDIKVNDSEWSALPSDDQIKIESIVQGFFKTARIVPDPTAARSTPPMAALAASTNPWCTAACNIAEAAAVAACATLANPIAIAACLAAAHEAGKLCRSKC